MFQSIMTHLAQPQLLLRAVESLIPLAQTRCGFKIQYYCGRSVNSRQVAVTFAYIFIDKIS